MARYVLAKTNTATDDDYEAIEAVIGHEYFHNWSGNRVSAPPVARGIEAIRTHMSCFMGLFHLSGVFFHPNSVNYWKMLSKLIQLACNDEGQVTCRDFNHFAIIIRWFLIEVA